MTKLNHLLGLLLIATLAFAQSDPSSLGDNPVDIVNGR